jgi:hemerythrin superfamily protein
MLHKSNHSRGALALSAAIGLGAGIVANFARKAVVQSPTLFGGNWADALTAEHEATLELFDALDETTIEDTGTITSLLTQIKHALGKHAFQEENAIYPALRQHGLAERSDELNQEHALVKSYLYQLTETERSDPTWLPKAQELRTALEAHMREEEQVVFPSLRKQLSDDENKRLTSAMNREGFKLA